MKKVLTIIGGDNAVAYFRFLMQVNYINLYLDFSKIETIYLKDIDFDSEYIYGFDIVHFHANALQDKTFSDNILKLKGKGIKLIMDCDDYWDLPKTSPYYLVHKVKDNIHTFLPLVDAVTTTTSLFRDVLRHFNKNVYIIPNCIDKSLKQYENKPTGHSRLRIGLIGGASHLYDLKIMNGFTKYLAEELKNDIQLVLCGFDTRGQAKPEFSLWNEFEQILTDNYKILTKDNLSFLLRYNEEEYPYDSPYRRMWSKGIYEYATMYNEIDILIAPIENNKFNCMKSELKAIEAGTMGKVLIASNVGINKVVLKDNENALLIDNCRGPEQWAKAIKKLIRDKDLFAKLKLNLAEKINKDYNIDTICKKRIELYTNLS